jgi:hypothetical protein
MQWNYKIEILKRKSEIRRIMNDSIKPFGFVFRVSVVIICSIFSRVSFAQIDNRFISDRIEVNQRDTNSWGLSVNSFNYMRNTEYFNDIELGRTLFGYQLNPSLFVQPNDHVKLQAGVFVRSDFGGQPTYTKILPTFSLKIQNRNTSFIFGTLEGALAHRMYEPLFDINSAIERRIENGFQLKHESTKSFFDLWINWERFIERGSPYKEQFTAGLNYTPVLYSSGSYIDGQQFSISLPVQGTAFHRGGQIDTDSSNMLMVFNGAIGLAIKKQWSLGFLRGIGVDVASVHYKENTNSGFMPYRNGQGFLGNATVNTQWLDLMLTYWAGDSYIAPRGTTIYQSVSLDKPRLTEKQRQLLFVRFLYQKQLGNNLNMSARFEPVYDLNNSIFDFSYSLYLTYNLNRRLGRLAL